MLQDIFLKLFPVLGLNIFGFDFESHNETLHITLILIVQPCFGSRIIFLDGNRGCKYGNIGVSTDLLEHHHAMINSILPFV